VYICAPLGGSVEENIEMAKRYMAYALKCGAAPVVPHFYAFALDDSIPEERQLGRNAGLSLLWMCDEAWIFGEEMTEGMRAETSFCRTMGVKTRKITDSQVNKTLKEADIR
jgi:hypothetical protein